MDCLTVKLSDEQIKEIEEYVAREIKRFKRDMCKECPYREDEDEWLN